jgi:hypothetical protein
MRSSASYLLSAGEGLIQLRELLERERSRECECCGQLVPEPSPTDAQRLDIKIWEALSFAKGIVWQQPDNT